MVESWNNKFSFFLVYNFAFRLFAEFFTKSSKICFMSFCYGAEMKSVNYKTWRQIMDMKIASFSREN